MLNKLARDDVKRRLSSYVMCLGVGGLAVYNFFWASPARRQLLFPKGLVLRCASVE
jgi:hypothetical protein